MGFAVPMVTFPEEYTISQTPIIFAELGKILDLPGSCEADEVHARQLLAYVADFFGEVKPADRLLKWANYFWAKLDDKDYVMGSLIAADFALFQVFNTMDGKKRLGKLDYTLPAALYIFLKF